MQMEIRSHLSYTSITPLAQGQTAHPLQNYLSHLFCTSVWPTKIHTAPSHCQTTRSHPLRPSHHSGTSTRFPSHVLWPLLLSQSSCHLEFLTCSPPSTCYTTPKPNQSKHRYTRSLPSSFPGTTKDPPLPSVLSSTSVNSQQSTVFLQIFLDPGFHWCVFWRRTDETRWWKRRIKKSLPDFSVKLDGDFHAMKNLLTYLLT